MYTSIKVCEYLEYLTLLQTLLLFDDTGSALRNTNTDKDLLLLKKQCLFLKKQRLPGAPTKVEFTFFPEILLKCCS